MEQATYAWNNSGITFPCDNIASHPMIFSLRYSRGILVNDFINMSANYSSVHILFTSKIVSVIAIMKWWYFTVIYLVQGLFESTLANYSASLLSLKSVQFISNFAPRISKIGFISRTNSLKGSASLDAVESAMYSVSVVDKTIAVFKRLNHVIRQSVHFIMYLLIIYQWT